MQLASIFANAFPPILFHNPSVSLLSSSLPARTIADVFPTRCTPAGKVGIFSFQAVIESNSL